jgi:hypothetical protein
MTLGTDAGDDFTINSTHLVVEGDTGNVGIGQANPAAGLVVASDCVISGGVGATDVEDGEILEVLSNTANKYALLVRHHGGTNTNGIKIHYSDGAPNGTGNDFINCLDTGGVRFQVHSSGDMTADTISIASDERLKENIVDCTSKLADINKLKVRNFNWREQDSVTGQDIHSEERASTKMIGLIAQEFEEVFPALVSDHELSPANEDRDALVRKTIKWSAIVPMLIKAIQELSAEVDKLKNGGDA